MMINIIHILFYAPIIISYALQDIMDIGKEWKDYTYYALVTIVLLGVLYHIYKYWNSRTAIKWGNEINLIHLIGVFPIIIYYLMKGEKALSVAKYLTLSIGVTGMLYHIKRLIN